MILKSFGCSFIFGTDLPDDGSGSDSAKFSHLTWPSLLAKELNYDYDCFARPGIGNLRILESILTQSTKPQPAVFVIGWTWIDRFDYTIPASGRINYRDLVSADVWKTVMPVDSSTVSENYYRDLHSQLRDKLTTLTYIKTAVDTLQQKNIPFVMTYMDDLIFESQWHTTSAIEYLQDSIRPHMIQFDQVNFLEWAKKNGFPISETHHPLEQAHSEAVKVLYKQNTVDRLRLA
jgi:hypothetical protein